MSTTARLFLLLGLFCVGSCDSTTSCRVDSECTPGNVCANGVCTSNGEAPDQSGFSPVDFASFDVAPPPGPPDGFSPDALTSGCPFNNDGIIQRAEIPAMAGLGGFFWTNQPNTTESVSLDAVQGVWDYSATPSADTKVFDGLESPAGAYWESTFPDASYVQLLDQANDLLGVYKIDDSHLYLLGVVSRTSSYPATSLKYGTPIEVLRFPLTVGETWTATSSVSGTAQGIAVTATETWKNTIDASGTVKTPAATFQTLRLRVDYTQLAYAAHLPLPGRVLRRRGAYPVEGQRDVQQLHHRGRVPPARCALTRAHKTT